MKRIFAVAYLLVITLVLLLVLSTPHAKAQVASTTVNVGVNMTLTADAGKFVAIPPCSLAAKCMAQLQLCNTDAHGQADSAHCIFIAAGNQNPFGSYLWVGVSQAVTNSAGGVSTTPYGFGTLRISVPNNEINIVP